MMLSFSHIKAVAFDLDGTLVDSMADLAAAANVMRVSLGMDRLPEKVLQSYVGDGLSVLVHRALCHDFNGLADSDLWEQGFTIFINYYAEHLACFSQPYPNVRQLLSLLHSLKLPLAVITNKREQFAQKLLHQLNLLDSFSLLLGADTLPEKKPSPLPLQYTAERFEIDVSELLMVGDSRNDVLAARAAKTSSVLVTYGYGNAAALQENKDTQADVLIDRIDELYDLLKVR